MKKNVIMRAACVVLVLTLLSTCMISGTFAKYVTDAPDVTDSARVAKWGVTAAVDAEDLFATAYKDAPVAYDNTETGDAITVWAEVEANLVAPGTESEQEDAIVVAGTPEVDVSVDYTADVTLTGWTINTSEFYCPLVFTVNGQTIKMDATNDTADKLAAALEDAITGLSADYDANTDLAAQANNNVDISWAWDFDDNGAGTNDAKDTALGNLADAPTVSITYGATVTQID